VLSGGGASLPACQLACFDMFNLLGRLPQEPPADCSHQVLDWKGVQYLSCTGLEGGPVLVLYWTGRGSSTCPVLDWKGVQYLSCTGLERGPVLVLCWTGKGSSTGPVLDWKGVWFLET
jgi:hypothetical protein